MAKLFNGSKTRAKVNKVVEIALGVFFVTLAIIILGLSTPSTFAGSLLAALLLGTLGGEAIVSAIRNKRSLLSRIGPLP